VRKGTDRISLYIKIGSQGVEFPSITLTLSSGTGYEWELRYPVTEMMGRRGISRAAECWYLLV